MSMMSCRSLDTYELLAGEAESRIVYVEAWIPTSNVGTTTPAQQTRPPSTSVIGAQRQGRFRLMEACEIKFTQRHFCKTTPNGRASAGTMHP